MNEADYAAADAEWDALPVIGPDHWSFLSRAELAESGGRLAIQAAVELQRGAGATWFRLTEDPLSDGVWIAGWSERPRKEAEFSPPVTAGPKT